MNIYFITGTSKGIGYNIAVSLLKNSSNFVYGLSRTNTIINNNFTHVKIDLSDIEQVNNFNFEINDKIDEIVLINNAGIIGDIKQTGKVSNKSITDTYNINTIAPSVLINKFISQFQNEEVEKIILNISSGAGRHTISSWASYCASKSALDMYSQVVYDEQKRINRKKSVKIYSIAPGIVDTPMQDVIRSAKVEDFEFVNQFIDYKEKLQLTSPKEVAEKLISFLNNSNKYKNVIYDLREL